MRYLNLSQNSSIEYLYYCRTSLTYIFVPLLLDGVLLVAALGTLRDAEDAADSPLANVEAAREVLGVPIAEGGGGHGKWCRIEPSNDNIITSFDE